MNTYSRKGSASVKTWPFSVSNLLAVSVNVAHTWRITPSAYGRWLIRKAFVTLATMYDNVLPVSVKYEESTTNFPTSAARHREACNNCETDGEGVKGKADGTLLPIHK